MNKIYVGNLSYDASEDDLMDFFSAYGEIKDIKLIRDRDSGRLKGFGFIEYNDGAQAKAALEANSQKFLGRPLKVSLAKEKEKR